MPTNTLLRSWLPACQCRSPHRAVSSWNRRLSSSEIPAAGLSASRTSVGASVAAVGRTADGSEGGGGGALDRAPDVTVPIGSSTLAGESTNAEPRSDSSGTDIVRIVRDASGWAQRAVRHPRSGTSDRTSGMGGIMDSTLPLNQEWRIMSAPVHIQKGDASM